MILFVCEILWVMPHVQTILQYFYKLLMWQIINCSHLGPLLTSYFYLPIINHHISSLKKKIVK